MSDISAYKDKIGKIESLKVEISSVYSLCANYIKEMAVINKTCPQSISELEDKVSSIDTVMKRISECERDATEKKELYMRLVLEVSGEFQRDTALKNMLYNINLVTNYINSI
jgi:hypothetical protein